MVLAPNIIIGIIRNYFKDPIPYFENYRKYFLTGNAKNSKINMYEKSLGFFCDMSKQMEYPFGNDSILRVYDKFGFSNVYQNKFPDIIFIGDSFLNDPFTSCNNGIQSLTDNMFNRKISYNIGSEGCCGFKVYNELMNIFFQKKPKLIVFEVVERNAKDNILKATAELKNRTEQTDIFKYLFLDLIFGDNYKSLEQSNIFKKKKVYSNLGYEHFVENRKIWFLNNKLTRISAPDIENIIQSMKVIKQILIEKNIQIIFVIAPDKESVFPKMFGVSNLEILQNEMVNNNIDYIDMYTPMLNHGINYYSLGDSHWNANAIKLFSHQVFYKYNEIIKN